jgi:4-hydroxy-2-oxoheptanedioate aldolase
MALPSLARRLRAGEVTFCGWVSLPEPLIAELVARAGFDCVALEMQHGLHDVASVMRGIGAVALAGKPAVVRIPVADNANASRFLDMGAEAIIAPMINSVADARALVAAAKYPPLGERSWGPPRAMALQEAPDPSTHLATANGNTLALAMIETRQALEALEEILAVDGIDGVFVGPSDLSVTLSGGKKIAPTDSFLDQPIQRIAERTRATGKVAGIFAVSAARARQFRDWGYRFIALGSDQIYLADGAGALLAAARSKG